MSSAPPRLTDLNRLKAQRQRARRADNRDAFFLHDIAVDEVQERLAMVNRAFTAPAIVTDFPEIWAAALPGATIVADEERLALAPGAHDLVVHAMGLHWANDPVGQIVQARLALKPDGLFLACQLGGQTLAELRAALVSAETALRGGIAPRVAPMADLRDLGGLLQRAGLTMPVVASLTQTVSYRDIRALMRDLRAMGEGNALAHRDHRPLDRALMAAAGAIYAAEFPSETGGIAATFELIFLSGWSSHPDQPKPLRPGSAVQSLSEALARAKSESGN